jgi:hypothetical protein
MPGVRSGFGTLVRQSTSRVTKGPLAMLLVTFWVAGCLGSHCISDPVAQFRMNGVTYAVFGNNRVAQNDLGRLVGKITAGLPSGATRCVTYTLKDGQGTPPLGTDVYAIKSVSESVALAVADSGVTLRYDAEGSKP